MTRRVETIGDCTLYLGDCRDILPTLGDCAIVSDPPYGIGFVKGQGGKGIGRNRNIKAIHGDDEPFDPTHLLGFPHVLIWGGDHFAQRLPRGRWLVWDKLDGVASFDSFSDVEVAWHNRPGAARIFRHLWKGLLQGSEKGPRRYHPTQKPVALMEWCLDQLPPEAAALPVCDPYMGVGTTAVACVRRGRRFVGVEIDPEYFEVAVRRVSEAVVDAASQPRLFAEPEPKPVQPSLYGDVA